MNHEDQEKRIQIFMAFDWKCQGRKCTNDVRQFGTPQLAHRVIKSKKNLEKYGPEIIHHRFNLAPACSLVCNGTVNIENKPMQKKRLIAAIRAEIALEKKRRTA